MASAVFGLLLLGVAGAAGAQERETPSVDEPELEEAVAVSPSPFEVPPPSDQARRYYITGNALWVVSLAWGLAVPLLFLFLGWAAALRDWVRRWAPGWMGTVLGVFAAYSLLTWLLDLPLSIFAGFVRPHAYGLSNQTFGAWLGDSAKALGVSLVAGSLVFAGIYLLLRLSPRRWWLWAGLLTLPFLIFTVFVAPIWIAPLFDDFGPMEDEALEAKILALADRVEVEAERVFEVDKSADTNRVNAYVTGIGGTHRIVLWDTLLAALEDDEVLVVMAHELGHYVQGHVWKGILLAWVGSLVALFLVDRLGRTSLTRWQHRWGFERLADPASLPLVLLLLAVLGLAGSPFALAYSRHQERSADRFARELTRDPEACAGAFQKLLVKNLSYPYPGPVYEIVRASHPPIGERIESCRGGAASYQLPAAGSR